MRTYALLARLPFPKSYVGKMLLVASLGIHVPLIALVLCLALYSPSDCGDAMGVLAVVLLATLLGAAVTLRVLYLLLEPVSLASKALRDYADHGKMTDLPIWFTGPAGRLMADVQYAVEHLDNVIRSLKEGSTKDYLGPGPRLRRGDRQPHQPLQPAPAVLRAALGAGGTPPITFHDLRHTCASLLFQRNVHPKFVQELLGHASVAITLDTYSHMLPGTGSEAVDAMSEALG